jgi:glutathione S-transferase
MLRILGRKTSSNVQKVLWCCAELGLAFEREDYGGDFGKTGEPDYLALNPNATVPTIIEDGGYVLWESNAIIRYLAARHAPGRLIPDDLHLRYSGERWMDWQANVVRPALQPMIRILVRTRPEDRDPDAVARARDALSAAMAIADRYLAGTPYLAGDAFTVCDIPLGISAYRWFNLDIEREDYPSLRRWHDALAARPPFREHIATGLA